MDAVVFLTVRVLKSHLKTQYIVVLSVKVKVTI